VRIDHVGLVGFRCYARAETDLAPGISLVVGANGSGKTTLLEALHMALLAYSPRTSVDTRCIRSGEAFMRAEASGETRSALHTSSVAVSFDAAKRVLLDGRHVRRHADLDAWWAVIVFLPERLALIQRSASVRRAYLDRAAIRLAAHHRIDAAAYATALTQRNALLRRIRAGSVSAASLDAWDQHVAEAGARVTATRAAVCATLAPLFADRMRLLGGSSTASLRYQPSVPGTVDHLLRGLGERRRRDIERAFTTIGPHMDEVEITDHDRPLRGFGSQGEQRTAVLALLLAEAAAVREVRGEAPVLLLDDVASELDTTRRQRLVAAVQSHGQAVVTATERDQFPAAIDLVLHAGAGRLRA
jgi:DNA replication and repair protein RecF